MDAKDQLEKDGWVRCRFTEGVFSDERFVRIWDQVAQDYFYLTVPKHCVQEAEYGNDNEDSRKQRERRFQAGSSKNGSGSKKEKVAKHQLRKSKD